MNGHRVRVHGSAGFVVAHCRTLRDTELRKLQAASACAAPLRPHPMPRKGGHTPPAHLPKSHVQPAEFVERLEAPKQITDTWSH